MYVYFKSRPGLSKLQDTHWLSLVSNDRHCTIRGKYVVKLKGLSL